MNQDRNIQGSSGKKLSRAALCVLLGSGLCAVPGAQAAAAPPRHQAPQRMLLRKYGKLPLSFEPNVGQADPHVHFLARGAGYGIFLRTREADLRLDKSLLRLRVAGANPKAAMSARQPLASRSNYLVGAHSQWRTNVANFAEVMERNIYRNIDLRYYGNQRRLEYDFLVHPGAAVNTIAMRVDGASRLRVLPNGNVAVYAGNRTLSLHAPLVYQRIHGRLQQVSARYELANNELHFKVGAFDHAHTLVIDPSVVYSTFLGGSGNDQAAGIAVDASGNAYVVGQTASTNFPVSGALQGSLAGNVDAFVTKLNASGTGVVYSTYLGGSSIDQAIGVAVDGSGDAYVTGLTTSSDFPVTSGAISGSYSGNASAFITELNPSGQGPVFSTYLGGNGATVGNAITVDGSGNVYVAGNTGATNFPTTSGVVQSALVGTSAGFVISLKPSGAGVNFATVIGGSGSNNIATGIAVDGSGNIYVAGETNSTDMHTTNGSSNAGGNDAYVAKLNAGATSYGYLELLGGSNDDGANGIAIDGSGNAYVTGFTLSSNFPTKAALQGSLAGPGNAFIAKLDGSGNVVYSTFLGGGGQDTGAAIAVDGSGDAFVAGITTSSNFPTASPTKGTLSGNTDAFLSEVNPSGSGLVFSTYIGGSSGDAGTALALDSGGNAYVAGWTGSSDFPTQSAYQGSFQGGSRDAFVMKFSTGGSLSGGGGGGGGTPAADFSMSLAPASVTVAAGKSASYTLTITPSNGFNSGVNLTCSGAPKGATCTIANATVTPDGTNAASTTVTITTTSRSALAPLNGPANGTPVLPLTLGWLGLAAMVGLGIYLQKRSRFAWVPALAAVGFCAIVMTACGGSSSPSSGGSSGNPNGTPAGTYTITVNGASGNTTHSATTSMVVQ